MHVASPSGVKSAIIPLRHTRWARGQGNKDLVARNAGRLDRSAVRCKRYTLSMQLLSLRWESHVSVAGKMSSEKDFSIERLWNHADNAGRLAAPALSFRFYWELRQQVVCLLFESASRKHLHRIASRVYLWKKPLIFALCQSSDCCRLRAKFLFTVVTAIRDRLPRVLDCGLSQRYQQIESQIFFYL